MQIIGLIIVFVLIGLVIDNKNKSNSTAKSYIKYRLAKSIINKKK